MGILKRLLLASCLFAAIASAKGETAQLTLPQLDWHIDIKLPDLNVKEVEIAPSGQAVRLFGGSRKSGYVFSAFLEKAESEGDAKAARKFYSSKGSLPSKDVSMSESGDFALLSKTVSMSGLEQKNVNAFLSKDGYWIDLHISSMDDKTTSAQLSEMLVKGASITKDSALGPGILIALGHFHRSKDDFAQAGDSYWKALKSGAPEPGKAVPPGWKRCAAAAASCIGNSGDLKKAKEFLDWAMTIAPEDPILIYNRACLCAELGDNENALKSLAEAYKHKDKLLPRQSIPDPLEDNSFAKLVKEPKLKEEILKLKESAK